MAKTFTKADKAELPRFRYLDDYTRYLSKLSKEVDETSQLVDQYQKIFASLLKSAKRVNASMTFEVTPRDRKEQLSDVRRLKTNVDMSLKKVVIPDIEKLSSQYALAEDLHEKHKLLDSMESQLSLQFPDRRGDAYNNAVTSIRALKAKVAGSLSKVLGFLHEIAAKHVPETFQAYMDSIATLINKHVVFKDSDLYLYVSTSNGDLVFTYYLMLRDVVNDDGFITPHLYISVQWLVSKESTVEVQLNHEYEVPNKLLGHGHAVGNVQDALKSISTMLEAESFSTALGVVPMALLMKSDPSKLSKEFFSFRDFIKAVTVDENYITFTLRPEADSPELVKQVAYQLYIELRTLVKSKGVKLIMKEQQEAGTTKVVFNLTKVAAKGEVSHYDLEFLRDKFGLKDSQMRKVAQIING